jgi:transcriptional regulator with XRE-family HTH domain
MNILSSQEIGAKLREFRKRRKFTQEQLAECIDVTFQQIQLYENGTNRLNTDKLQLIAKALSVPVGSFFSEFDDERTLSEDEQQLLSGFRALKSPEVKEYLLNSLK